MKKTVSFIMAMCLLICGCSLTGSAADAKSNVFYYKDNTVEVTVLGDDISYDKMKQIADCVAGVEDDDGVSECGIACIFGHKLETTTSTSVTHNAYTTSPKCVKNTYSVEYCTRSSCDYSSKTLISSTRIATCHG